MIACLLLATLAQAPATLSGVVKDASGLPMQGAADSLNISAAAAVLFYEALRQRTRGVGLRPAEK